MLAGHYAPALLIKARYPDVRLWVLFLAVQAVDIFFFVFALVGIEEMSVTNTRGPLGMHLEHVPHTHSLFMNVVFASVCIGIGAAKKQLKLGVLIGLAVCSHWALDLLVHVPDLPLVPWEHDAVGLGLWEYVYASLALEIVLVTAAYVLFRKTIAEPTTRRYADLGMLALVFVQISYVLGPRMPSVLAMAAMAEFIYLGFVLHAAGVDRRLQRSR